MIFKNRQFCLWAAVVAVGVLFVSVSEEIQAGEPLAKMNNKNKRPVRPSRETRPHRPGIAAAPGLRAMAGRFYFIANRQGETSWVVENINSVGWRLLRLPVCYWP